jgi:hypothetical protein
MRADVFQVVALCCHADAYLSGASDRIPELLSNASFAPVHEVVFERPANGRLAGGIVADAPGPWLRRLEKESVEKLSVSLSTCPFDPLVTPSGPWGILSDGDVGVEIWQPTWRKRIRSHSDTSPWRVSYASTRSSRWIVQMPFTFSDTSKLLKSLIVQSAGLHPLLARLQETQSSPFPDLYPPEWPEERAELGQLAATAAALLRSDEWAQAILRREITPLEHDAISQKLWKVCLMALEASVKKEDAAGEHQTGRLAS